MSALPLSSPDDNAAVWGELDSHRAAAYAGKALRNEHDRIAPLKHSRRRTIFGAARRLKRLELAGVLDWARCDEALMDAGLMCANAQPGDVLSRNDIREQINAGAARGVKQGPAKPPKERPRLAGAEEAMGWIAALDAAAFKLPRVRARTAQAVAKHLREVFVREDGSLRGDARVALRDVPDAHWKSVRTALAQFCKVGVLRAMDPEWLKTGAPAARRFQSVIPPDAFDTPAPPQVDEKLASSLGTLGIAWERVPKTGESFTPASIGVKPQVVRRMWKDKGWLDRVEGPDGKPVRGMYRVSERAAELVAEQLADNDERVAKRSEAYLADRLAWRHHFEVTLADEVARRTEAIQNWYDNAASLEALGLSVLPVYGVREGGRCGCELHADRDEAARQRKEAEAARRRGETLFAVTDVAVAHTAPSQCDAIGKHPAVSAWSDDISNQSPAERQRLLGYWASRFPYGNIALRTEDLVVLDFDGHDEHTHERVPLDVAEVLAFLASKGITVAANTPAVRTGSGGFTLWFRRPVRSSVTNCVFASFLMRPGLRVQVDVRTNGGYAIVPPSAHWSGGHYEWINPMVHKDELRSLPSQKLKQIQSLTDCALRPPQGGERVA